MRTGLNLNCSTPEIWSLLDKDEMNYTSCKDSQETFEVNFSVSKEFTYRSLGSICPRKPKGIFHDVIHVLNQWIFMTCRSLSKDFV